MYDTGYDSKSVNEEYDSNKASGHVAENKPDPTDVDFVMKVVDGKVGIWTNIKIDAGKNIGPLMVTQLNSPSKVSLVCLCLVIGLFYIYLKDL